jgi:sulfoxide reductase heme-binding subunit YedZ
LRWSLASAVLLLVLLGTAGDTFRIVGDWLGYEHDRLPWYVTRISALLAYLALTGSVVYGLLLSTSLADRFAHRAISVTLHKDLAGVGLALALVHAAVLMLDRSVPYAPLEVLVPFIGPYRPLYVALGQAALGLSLIIMVTTYLRGRMARQTWLRIHRLAFVAWAAATAHGLMAGSDTGDATVMSMYVVATTVVAFLMAFRLVPR